MTEWKKYSRNDLESALKVKISRFRYLSMNLNKGKIMPKFDGIEIVGLPDGWAPKLIVVVDNDKEMGVELGLEAIIHGEKEENNDE